MAVARSSSGGVAIPGRSLMSTNALFILHAREAAQWTIVLIGLTFYLCNNCKN